MRNPNFANEFQLSVNTFPRRRVAGSGLSAYPELVVSSRRSLGVELGSGITFWTTGERHNSNRAAPTSPGTDLGPAWLTGGSYGIEGGLACTITLVISTLFIWRSRWVSATEEMRRLTSQENPAERNLVVSAVPQTIDGAAE